MPSLLSLPRELRDLIYHSLLTSPPPSSPRFLTPPSPSCPLITPLPPPGPSALAYPLLLTSHQLHTELSTLIHTLSTRQPPSYTLTLHIISETHIRPHWTHVPFLSSHLERLSITIAQSGARDGESRSVFMPARGTPATSATFVSHFLALMRAILHTATIGTLDISIPLPSPLPPGGLIPAHPIRRRLEPNRGALVHPRIVGDALSVNVDYFLQNPTGREEEEEEEEEEEVVEGLEEWRTRQRVWEEEWYLGMRRVFERVEGMRMVGMGGVEREWDFLRLGGGRG